MIEVIGNHLIHLTFKNNVTVSIHIGGGSYSDNHDMEIGQEMQQQRIASSNAEVMVYKQKETLTQKIAKGAEANVIGWQSPENILEILIAAAAYKSASKEKE